MPLVADALDVTELENMPSIAVGDDHEIFVYGMPHEGNGKVEAIEPATSLFLKRGHPAALFRAFSSPSDDNEGEHANYGEKDGEDKDQFQHAQNSAHPVVGEQA